MMSLQERPLPATESNWFGELAGKRWRLVCAMVSVVPLLMLATVVILRGGFPTPLAALWRITGISLLVINAGAFGSTKNWLLSAPMSSLLTLVVATGIGLSPLGTVGGVGTGIAVLGGLICLWNLTTVVMRTGLLPTVALVLLGLFLGLYAESMYWRVNSVHDIVYPESIVAGRVATDVAEQAAVVNMIATYHIASTGLDGLLPLKYHNGSLWMAEGLRRLSGFRALDFLAYAYGILLIPLYAVAFFGCAAVVRASVNQESGLPPLVFLAATVVAFVGVFPLEDDPLHLNFNEIVINSDSFLLAISLSLLLIGVGVWFFESLSMREFTWRLQDKIAVAALLPAALIWIGWIKISQIYLLLALAAYLGCRVKWLRTWPFLLGTSLSAVALAGMLHGERGANLSRFAPFNFDRIAPEWVPYFFVFYFAWVWLLLVLWARWRGTRTLGELWVAVRGGESLLVELAFVMVGAGLLPYLLIDFYSPAWKYFTEFQGVLSGVFVIAFVPVFRWTDLMGRARDGSLRLTTALLVGLAVAVSGHLFMTTVGATYRMIKRGCETRAVMAGGSDTAWRQQLRQIKARRSVVAASMAKRISVTACLDRLGEQPAEQRRGTALYIPKINRTYWDMRQLGDGATPFLAPALAGMPMVDGLPEFGCRYHRHSEPRHTA